MVDINECHDSVGLGTHPEGRWYIPVNTAGLSEDLVCSFSSCVSLGPSYLTPPPWVTQRRGEKQETDSEGMFEKAAALLTSFACHLTYCPATSPPLRSGAL